MKILPLLFAIAIPAAVFGQKVPDDDKILEIVMNPESPYYYPQLMSRYNAGDTTLTDNDYYYLYYGFASSNDYKPLTPIAAEDRVLMVFERTQGNPDYDSMLEIIRYAQETMKQDPFGPRNLNFLVYAYGAIGDTINERINYDRMTKVINAIKMSGTGLIEKSPMHILRLSHAADVLATYGLNITKRLVVSRTTEYISVEDQKGKQLSKGYYFDYSRVYKHSTEEAPRKKSNWKINEYPIGGFPKKQTLKPE